MICEILERQGSLNEDWPCYWRTVKGIVLHQETFFSPNYTVLNMLTMNLLVLHSLKSWFRSIWTEFSFSSLPGSLTYLPPVETPQSRRHRRQAIRSPLKPQACPQWHTSLNKSTPPTLGHMVGLIVLVGGFKSSIAQRFKARHFFSKYYFAYISQNFMLYINFSS